MQELPITKPAVPRLDMVDLLRGLSIVAVVLLHTLIRFSSLHVRLGRDWPPLTRHFVFFNGENGVTVFFAVSGFLITLTSLRRFGSLSAMRPKIFYRIRFARIMPLLLLLLAVLSVLHLAHIESFRINEKFFTLPRALVSALTFHLNWLEASRDAWLPACWTVLWSLSIEEMFYLFFPVVCVVLLRRGRWGTAAWFLLAAALITIGPFARTIWAHTDLQQENSYLAGMASIAAGCLTAWLTEFARQRGPLRIRLLWLVQIAGWAFILLIAISPHWPLLKLLGKSGTDDTVLALGACLVMFATTLRSVRGRVWTAPLRWLGRHSYEIYLSHEFVVIAVAAGLARWYPSGAPRAIIAVFVLSIVLLTAPLGWMLAKWWGEPLNRRLRGAQPAST